eukprot:7218508-Ditylum_brightwellii.AAC.1
MKNNREYEYNFVWNVNRKIDVEQGSYQHASPTRTVPKYKPFLVGVAEVPLGNGEFMGKQLQAFVYTERKVESHSDWEFNIQLDISFVKRVGNEHIWVKKVSHKEGKIWENDDVTMMKGLSKKEKKS